MADTPQSFANKLRNLKSSIEGQGKRIQQAAFDGVIGQQKNRIFDDGLAANMNSIDSIVKAAPPREGAYSKGHAKRRKRENRKVDKVNLFLFGNLFDSLETGVNGDDIVYGFVSTEQAKIAGYHEEYRGLKIFQFSDEEVNICIEAGLAEINFIIEQSF
jgi:hypothetical protein